MTRVLTCVRHCIRMKRFVRHDEPQSSRSVCERQAALCVITFGTPHRFRDVQFTFGRIISGHANPRNVSDKSNNSHRHCNEFISFVKLTSVQIVLPSTGVHARQLAVRFSLHDVRPDHTSKFVLTTCHRTCNGNVDSDLRNAPFAAIPVIPVPVLISSRVE